MEAAQALGMSESSEEKSQEAEKGKGGGGNKLLVIIALANFLGVFALGGYLAYDKLHASHAAAQADKKDGHGEGEKKEGEEKAAEGHGEEKAEAEGEDHGEKAEEHGEKKAEGHGGETDEHLNPPDGPGPIIALDAIVTNLAEPDTDRYLKVTVQLRITSEAARAEVEASLVPIRSGILMYFSSLNVADLTGAEKRRALQSNVRRIANEAMPSSRIRFVYFTELVIQ